MSRPFWVALGTTLFLVAALMWSRPSSPQSASRPSPGSRQRSTHAPASTAARSAEPAGESAPAPGAKSVAPMAGDFAVSASGGSASEDLSPEGALEGPIAAEIKAGGGVIRSAPNALGLFPRVNIALEEKVEVSVVYAEAQPGDMVVVQAEDGGVLDQNRTALQLQLDGERRLRFAFKSTAEGGIYRVTLRRGFEEKRLEFWGGREPVASSD